MVDGAVAQLGERRVRNAKVSGSIPLGSTIPGPRLRVVSSAEVVASAAEGRAASKPLSGPTSEGV